MTTFRQQNILELLNEIDFHDVPVNKISFQSDSHLELIIGFLLYNEIKDEYEEYLLKFININILNSNKLILSKESDFEINTFDYYFDGLYNCKLLFLLGFGEPSFEIQLKCETILLEKK
jgi:hypothetical protein